MAKTSSTEEFIEAIRRHIPDVVWRQIILDTAADIITDRELTMILSMNRKKVK